MLKLAEGRIQPQVKKLIIEAERVAKPEAKLIWHSACDSDSNSYDISRH